MLTIACIVFLLIAYPNSLAVVIQRFRWDAWHTFSLGNPIVALGLVAFSWQQGLSPSVWGRATWSAATTGVTIALIPLLLISILLYLPGPGAPAFIQAGIGMLRGRYVAYRLFIQVGVATVLCEELMFRGVLYSFLIHHQNPLPTIVISGVTFGLWHTVLQYQSYKGQRQAIRLCATVGGVIAYATLGSLLSYLRQADGSIVAPIVAHGALDLGMFALMVVRRRQLELTI